MSTKGQSIEISGISVEVVRKDIKNLHLGVYPPNGSVRVAAPLRVSDDAVRLAVVTRLGWVRRQQKRFRAQDRQSPREIVSGETHYFRGRRYRLEVIEAGEGIGVHRRSNGWLQLRVRPGSPRGVREKILTDWYREMLHEDAEVLFRKWAPRVGVDVRHWAIRKMKTRWGTCNNRTGRIWLNVELAKKSKGCVELIVVHELVHLLFRHHNESFMKEMERHLPNWRSLRQELNRAPLGHYGWDY